MPAQPRSDVLAIGECAHGVVDPAEEGFRPGIVDFGVNCNPLGPPPGLREELAKVDVSSYPDREARELRRAITLSIGVDRDSILVGNGSSELMWLAAAAYLERGDRALILGPTFGEYERAVRVAGAEAIYYRCHERGGAEVRRIAATIRETEPKLVFLCNPNNPTGGYLSRSDVESVVAACTSGMLVLDEAYAAFVPQRWSSLDLAADGRVLALRSMTKDYALAGLRLGYAVGSSLSIKALRQVAPPWSVNSLAQRAGIVAVSSSEHLERSRQAVAEARAYLTASLRGLGLGVWPSGTNFILVDVPDARSFRSTLMARGYCVRDCTSFGLPCQVRIAVRTLEECRGLVAAIRSMITTG